MLANLHRDEATVPIVERVFAAFHGYLAAARDILMHGRRKRSHAVQAAIGHTLAFATWRSLTREQGLDDRHAAELMCRLVEAAVDLGETTTVGEERATTRRVI